jgi:hypothetical protein
MRRIRREGFMHVWLAPFFGYYPWRCSNCQEVQLLKARGKKKSTQEGNNPQEKPSAPVPIPMPRKPLN